MNVDRNVTSAERERRDVLAPLHVGAERRQSNAFPSERRNSRRPSFCKTEASWDSKSILDLNTGLPPDGPRLVNVPTWIPNEADANITEQKQTKNILDRKSLYSIRGVNLASRDLRFVHTCPSYYNDPTTTNVQHLVEKNYIAGSRLANATPEKFPKVILRRFHRLSHTDVFTSYGMPRPPSSDLFDSVLDTLKREPSIVNIDNYPMLQEPVSCSKSDQYCEILGPSACQSCIENTNRHIGEELQHMSFPRIEMTPDRLVYPRLSRLFRDGHKLQVKRNKFRELGIEIPPELYKTINRKETAMSSSTCCTCKKPIRVISGDELVKISPKESEKLHGRNVKKAHTARV